MHKCGEYHNILGVLVCIVFDLDSESLSYCYHPINLTKLSHIHHLVHIQLLSHQLMNHLIIANIKFHDIICWCTILLLIITTIKSCYVSG